MFRKRVLSNIVDYGIFMIIIWFMSAMLMVLINIKGGAKLKPILFSIETFCVLAPILKDVILRERSIGKKIVGLRIMSKDNTYPNVFQLIVRNLFILIWPVECIFLLLEKERVGDKVAGTKVVEE